MMPDGTGSESDNGPGFDEKLLSIRSDDAGSTSTEADKHTESGIKSEKKEQAKALTPSQRSDMYSDALIKSHNQRVRDLNKQISILRKERDNERVLLADERSNLSITQERLLKATDLASGVVTRLEVQSRVSDICSAALIGGPLLLSVASYHQKKAWSPYVFWCVLSSLAVLSIVHFWTRYKK